MALQLLSQMAILRIEIDTITFGAAIRACDKDGELEKALEVCSAMTLSDVELDTITLGAAIGAYAQGDEREEALQLFGQVSEKGKFPA